ncbi:hypothetical protein [Bradyrhizobium sp.]|uniref:hypothetical protein n=1 Tax=Bradyrhizobium sp. TaxID=376 RepID=UPI00261FF6CC|nr:hypothetical protein [Bradyrhizobium sp.]
MQWYVCLITIPAAFFIGQVIVELIGRQTRTILQLRNRALERMLAFRNLQLPGPRELAVSSREIRCYDEAVRNVRHAQGTFAELGAQLLAFAESEPTIRALMALCGLDIVLAGHELIKLSEIYAAAKIDSDELRRAIEGVRQATLTALAASRQLSGNGLIKIRLEPMGLRNAASSRTRKSLPGRPRVRSRRARPLVRSASGPATRFARSPQLN